MQLKNKQQSQRVTTASGLSSTTGINGSLKCEMWLIHNSTASQCQTNDFWTWTWQIIHKVCKPNLTTSCVELTFGRCFTRNPPRSGCYVGLINMLWFGVGGQDGSDPSRASRVSTRERKGCQSLTSVHHQTLGVSDLRGSQGPNQPCRVTPPHTHKLLGFHIHTIKLFAWEWNQFHHDS